MNYEFLKASIRDIPDYPKPGVVFKDITTLLKDPTAFRAAHQALFDRFHGRRVDLVAAVEARGFIIGGALAVALNAGFIPLRKPGKLPAAALAESYALEYGEDQIHMHTDAIRPGEKVLLIDDLLATGGTLAAAARLVEKVGGQVVGIGVIVELAFLDGRHRLRDYDVYSVLRYDAG